MLIAQVLVWTKAPFVFRNELVPADGLTGERRARPDDLKRLGIAASGEHRDLLRGPYGEPVD